MDSEVQVTNNMGVFKEALGEKLFNEIAMLDVQVMAIEFAKIKHITESTTIRDKDKLKLIKACIIECENKSPYYKDIWSSS